MLGFFRRLFSKDRYYYKLVYRTLGVTPQNIDLYKLALIHRSASIVVNNDPQNAINNERLEFLGDAVLGAISAELVFIEYPELSEGGLTQLRSKIVNRDSINLLAKRIHIDREIIATPSQLPLQQKNIIGDAMEALIGALYLDQGYNRTNRIVIDLIHKKLNVERMTHTEKDFKSRVIEWAQKHRSTIEFATQTTPTHTDRTPEFHTILLINNQNKGEGLGRSKKSSEQKAAQQFFETFSQ